ncbi:FG-GAP repeat protein, partial [candidate division KSB1 bacterium]
GRAYIYHGGSTMGDPANLTISGASAGDYLGIAVACAGDINGDHFDDVIIGEDGYSANKGRARIYYGGTGMDAVADVTFLGEGAGNNFGRAVACAGDVNKDNVADIIIGAPSYGALTGRAYIYFGSSSMTGSADITLTGEGVNSSFGESVSCAGDVNNDGYDDIIIGAPAYLPNGKAYLYGESTPIAVELSSFTAQIQQDGILIKWEAQTETNCAGYNIYRREESASDFIKINETMILSRGTNSQGVTYSYLDTPPAGNYVYKLQSIDLDGSDEFTEPVSASMTSLVEQPSVPLEFALLQNYPNPFNPQTTIRFDLPASAEVTLVVYDMQGRVVRTLVSGHRDGGAHYAVWDAMDDSGRTVASGLYIYHLTAGEFSHIRKMTLLK